MTLELDRNQVVGAVNYILRCIFVALFVLGVVLPWVTPPVPTFYKEWLIVAAFAVAMLAPVRCASTSPLELAVLAVPLGLALFAVDRDMYIDAGMLVVAALVFLYAVRSGDDWVGPLAVALGIASSVSAGIAFVQVFDPSATSLWISVVATPGRASGNLGQPNHLATLLVLGLLAWEAMRRTETVHAALGGFAIAVLSAAIALTGSRTGWVSLAVVTGSWVLQGSHDRRVGALVVWACFALALAMQWQASLHGAARFYLLERAHGGSDVSSSRLELWRETLQIIAAHPLFGVGWGNFNWVWTFTPFPTRPPGFYTNAHNLPLQLFAEVGLPVGLLICATLVVVGWRLSTLQSSTWTSFARLALLTLTIHSGLEYPLWYAYFLLPGAFFLGYAVRKIREQCEPRPRPHRARRAALFGPASVLVVIGAITTARDFEKVKAVFAPSVPEMLSPLPPRIARAKSSWLFGYFGDYAAITTLGASGENIYQRPLHHLVNDQLLFAYAKQLVREGREDDARHALQRLREFRTPFALREFSKCEHPFGEGAESEQTQDLLVLMCSTAPTTSRDSVR